MARIRSARGRQTEDPDDRKGGSLLDAAREILRGSQDGGAKRKPLGVPSGFIAEAPYQPSGYDIQARQTAGPSWGPSRPIPMPPRYFDGNQYAPANASPGYISRLQNDLAFIGLLKPGDRIIDGDWGEAEAKAYAELLGLANQRGMSWETVLNQMKSQVGAEGGPGGAGRYEVDEFGNLVPVEGGMGPERAPFVARTTDPKTLELTFREAAMSLLGEGLTKVQIDGMIKSYNQMEIQRQQDFYNKQVAGGTVIDIQAPEAFAQSQLESQFPEETEEWSAQMMLEDAIGNLSRPAMGLLG